MTTKIIRKACLFLSLTLSVSFLQLYAQKSSTAKITVDVGTPGHTISPTLFGIFFEDINLSADGGLYAELIRNRSFEDADTLQYWKFIGAQKKSTASIIKANVHSSPPVPPLNPYNRKSLLIDFDGSFKLENNGYWGIHVASGERYLFKLAACAVGGLKTPLQVKIVSADGNVLASGEINGITSEWKYYPLVLTASAGDSNARLEISSSGNGKLFLDMVSLIPEKTWNNSGLRIDLAESINALKPTFLRFPGGCWVEGEDLAHMNNWKKTIGNIDTRTPLWNIWGYNATHSLGYHEYLQLSEDLGAEPLFCINAGISHREVVPMDQMGQWIQDALDAIEYANGPVTSVWGSIRAKNGHPEPFNLKYLEIGNENGMAPYAERWELFVKAIHDKYPDIVLIANEWAGGHPKNPKPQIVDEHYYSNPDWFIWNSNKYDSYDRNGSKIFVGEYAVTSGTGNGNLRGAIGEAAWMTGMERNSDIVVMAAYAPLFCHAKHKAWPVNLINFDNNRWFGIPSYYVQQMFATNQGTVNLPVNIDYAPNVEMPRSSGCIGLGTWLNSAEFKDLEVTAPNGKVLFKPDFSKIDETWKHTPSSEWSATNGVLKQSAISPNTTIYMGDTLWTDYTIKVKARKIEGENGFQIYFHNKNRGERTRWDLGGFTNSVNMLEVGLITESMPYNVEPGRWYDVKIELRGTSVKAYLDGKLIQEVSADESLKVKSLCSSASRDDKTGDIILKIVNVTGKSVKTEIDLKGTDLLTGNGEAIVLTSASPFDENTLDEPTKVSPKSENFKFSGKKLTRLFPGNSLTVLRLTTKK
ncbi:MAG: alpha-L-arabinofuranosidase C-terminal domain-containing protein [Dysgonomonas mossii]|uniref:alpha-L-arabinofuranosidase C-terminal domain-containing protein n=1 Tax=Dysgonomonas TaxID=156973 RepID=UPI0025B9532B|nr:MULTISPECIES: alpha-L-arabinofuranosidase C-terminal domain-containing protein [unclassified Dysgonomonas]